MQKTWVRSLGWEIPWRRKWQPIPVFLPGKSHEQRNLAGYSPWGRKKWDMNEWLSTHTSGIHGQTYILIYMLSHFSRVRLCATPKTAAHQALPSLGLSRQELWSGLPFASPMHDSEKWKWSRSVVSDSQRPHGLQPTRLLCPWDFPVKSTGVGCHCLKTYIITAYTA